MTRFPHLPVGDRKDDPPDKTLQWRLGLAIHKNPVAAAALIAIVLVSVPAWLIITQQVKLRSDTETITRLVAQSDRASARSERVSRENSELIDQIQQQRREAVGVLCIDNTLIISVLADVPRRLRTPVQRDALARARRVNCRQLVSVIETRRPPGSAPTTKTDRDSR